VAGRRPEAEPQVQWPLPCGPRPAWRPGARAARGRGPRTGGRSGRA
jgi:hypothetical protein